MKPAPVAWVGRGSPAFGEAVAALSASAWQPDRSPAAVARPRDAAGVRAALARAREEGRRVAVRSGGHSLSATHLLDGAVTVDLGALHHVAVDPETATAWVGPGATVERAARALGAAGFSFPLGHAPTVGLGGYLLAGGNGWNTPVWGHACERVLAADVVLPDATALRVDAGSHPDLFRALRGAGPAFPGIVTAFRLALVPGDAPSTRVTVVVDARDPAALGAALDDVVAASPPHLELTVFWRPARGAGDPPHAVVSATAFGLDDADAPDLLRAVPSGMPADVAVAGSLAALLGPIPRHPGEAMFSDHAWTRAGFAEVLPLLPRRDPDLSPCSSVLVTPAARRADGTAPDAALYAPGGTLSVSAYAHWDPAHQRPGSPVAWARGTIAALDDVRTGRYVGEADLTGGTSALADCFPPAALDDLRATAARYDPESALASPLHTTDSFAFPGTSHQV
ncbi:MULTISPECIES: FAD-binding oxidoreductase [unclassified Isoptericola]|uniref:FAD-binding oxidoreductase n=1 Tax=unclassified Isoptericola TaxID=2623355 RepID=UPI00365B280F